MCRLSLAWITSENSTMLWNQTHLDSLSLDPIPCCLASLLSNRQLCCLPLCCPAANCLSALQPPTALSALQPPTASSALHPPTALCWVASSTHIRVPLPLPDTARFHVQESFVWFRAKTDSSALVAYPHSATYLPLLPLSFILNKLQHDLTTSKKKTRTFTGSKNRNYKILKGFGRPLKKINK